MVTAARDDDDRTDVGCADGQRDRLWMPPLFTDQSLSPRTRESGIALPSPSTGGGSGLVCISVTEILIALGS